MFSNHSNHNLFDDRSTSSANQSQVDLGSVSFKYAKVLYDFNTAERDELFLEEDDIVQVLEHENRGGWLFGTKHDTWGWFPENYVRFLDSNEVEDSGIVQSIPTEIPFGTLSSRTSTINTRSTSFISPDGNETGSEEGTRKWASKYKNIQRYSKRNTGSNLDQLEASITDHSKNTITKMKRENSGNDQSAQRTASLKKDDKRYSAFSQKGQSSNSNLDKTVSIVSGAAQIKQRWVEIVGESEVEKLNLSKKEVQRQEVIREVFNTEQDYIEDLEVIINLYLANIRKSKLVQNKDIGIIFSNVEQLLPVNQMLHSWIKERTDSSPVVEMIGDLFIRVSDYLKMYTMYCSNYPYALMRLQSVRQNKSIAKLLDSCAKLPESKNFNLANFLIKPVQRICKYPLLVRELLKNTDEKHKDHENLIQALLKIETVCAIVNEGTRQAEAAFKMLELQNKFTSKTSIVAPSRVLLRHESVSVTSSSKERKKREFILFNDMIILAKSVGNDEGKLKLITMIPFDSFAVNYSKDDFEIEISPKNNQAFNLVFDGTPDKKSWKKSIDDAFDIFNAARNRANSGLTVTTSPSGSNVLANGSGSQASFEPLKLSPSVEGAFMSIDIIAEASANIVDKDDSGLSNDTYGSTASSTIVYKLSNDKDDTSLDNINNTRPRTSVKAKGRPSHRTSIPNPPGSSISEDNSPVTSSSSNKKSGRYSRPLPPNPLASNNQESTTIDTPINELPPSEIVLSRILSYEQLDSSDLPELPKKAPVSIIETLSESPVHKQARRTSTDITHEVKKSRESLRLKSKEDLRKSKEELRKSKEELHKSKEDISKSKEDIRKSKEKLNTTEKKHVSHRKEREAENRSQSNSNVSRSLSLKIASNPFLKSDTTNSNGPSLSNAPSKRPNKPLPPLSNSQTDNNDEVIGSDSIKKNYTKLDSVNIVSKPIKEAVISNVFKRSNAASGKDYVYAIDVIQVGNAGYFTIEQAYDDFFEFHMQLIGHFPQEGGVSLSVNNGSSSQRIIPELPGQMMFVSEASARGRVPLLQEYISQVLKLPPKISRSPAVLGFFKENGKLANQLLKSQ